jgi:hypothetical protein
MSMRRPPGGRNLRRAQRREGDTDRFSDRVELFSQQRRETIAGYNRRRIKAFCAAHAIDDPNGPSSVFADPDDAEPASPEDDDPRDGADPSERSRRSGS